MQISEETKKKIEKGEMLDVHEAEEVLEIVDTYEDFDHAPRVACFRIDGQWYSLEHGGSMQFAGVDVVWAQRAKRREKASDGFGL